MKSTPTSELASHAETIATEARRLQAMAVVGNPATLLESLALIRLSLARCHGIAQQMAADPVKAVSMTLK